MSEPSATSRALATVRQQGRADAAAAIRLAAESVVPGAEFDWLRPGHIRASDVRKWLIDWAANIAEHGPTHTTEERA
jgi:hypothetical protein